MDLWEAIVVAFRRWYVTLPVLAVGVLVALQLAESVSPVHEANATVQYLPPAVDILDQEVAFAAAANPYSDLRSLAFATELTVLGEDVAVELSESGFDADYEVTTDRREPVLYITARSTSPDSALGTLGALIDFVEEEAVDRQTAQFSADTTYHVTADVLRRDRSTAIDLTSQTRARVLLLAVAAIVAMGAAVLAEFVMSKLRDRDSGGAPGADEPGVVWFGVPMQGAQPPPAVPPQQPHLSPAPEIPTRATGTSDGHGDDPPSRRASRWSR